MKKFIRIIFTCFAVFFGDNLNKGLAQSVQQKIDSLTMLVSRLPPDTQRVNVLYDLAFAYRKVDHEKTIGYGNQALQIARENRSDVHIANSYHVIALGYRMQANYVQSLYYNEKALAIREKLQDKLAIAISLGNIGLIYRNFSDYPSALDYQLRSLKLSTEINDTLGVAYALGNIGIIYDYLKDYPKALEYQLKALKIEEALGNRSDLAVSLGNIGNIYREMGEFSKALDYHFQSLKLKEESNDKVGISRSLGNIGGVYFNLENYSRALEMFQKSLMLAEQAGDRSGLVIFMGNIGSLYLKTNNLKLAEKYCSDALKLAAEIGDENLQKNNLARLSEIHQKLGNADESLKYYKSYINIRDTLNSLENHKLLIQTQMKYDYQKKVASDSIKMAEERRVTDTQLITQKEQIKREAIQRNALYAGLVLLLLFAGFTYNRFKVTRNQKVVIELQKQMVEEKQKEVLDSIYYAKRIQSALLKSQEQESLHLPPHFVFFQPKDIVSGDFYWSLEKDGYLFLAVADCTGHGVPGAFLTMLCTSILNEITAQQALLSPAEILDKLRTRIIKDLSQTGQEGGCKDGMDISILKLHLESKNIQWAGANNPLWIIRGDSYFKKEEKLAAMTSATQKPFQKLQEVRPDKQPIGYHPNPKPFTNHSLKLNEGDSIYIFTDGYADQFGGPRGKKFKYAQLKELLLSLQGKNMKMQKEILEKRFQEWRGQLEQVDDVCIIGMKA